MEIPIDVAKLLPYYKMYAADAESDENFRMMTFEQRGCYWTLLNHAWLNGGLPVDEADLIALLKCSQEDFDRIWARVSKCFSEVNGRRRNKRQEEERELALAQYAKQSDGGRSTAAKRSATDDLVDSSTVGNLHGELCSKQALRAYESESVSESDVLSKKERWKIFQTRIKQAGVKFKFQYGEKKRAEDWLERCDEPMDDILAALEVFADDPFWTEKGHPWSAWPKQFPQFLETATGRAARGPQRVKVAVKVAESPRLEPSATGNVTASFLDQWNSAVPDALTGYDPRANGEPSADFVANFGKICEVARGFMVNKPDSTWLTYYWLLATKPPHTRPNWKRLITDMRGMAMPEKKSPEDEKKKNLAKIMADIREMAYAKQPN